MSMKVIKCATKDVMSTKEAQNLWHITEGKKVTLCGYKNLYLFTDWIELTEKEQNLCSNCWGLARKSGD